MKIKTKLGKGLSVFIAVLVFAAALAACSTSENNQSTGQSTSVSQDSKTSDKAGGESESTDLTTESVKKGADTENKAQAKQPEELPEVDANYKSADIKVGVLKGPTSLGMLKLFSYQFQISYLFQTLQLPKMKDILIYYMLLLYRLN